MASANNIRNKSPNKPLYNQKKEGLSMKEGKVIVDIEVCKNCKDHQWCTRHDEAKYNKMFEEVSSAIIAENPEVIVSQNSFVHVPTLGAFEITCMGALLYSKNRAGCFPNGAVIANLIKSYLIDKQEGKPTNHYDLRQIESNPNKEESRNGINGNFKKSNKSPPRSSSGPRGTRGRTSHYTGKGNCVEPYQFVVSSTFGQGKRSPDQRQQSSEKSLNMSSTVQSGFFNSNANPIKSIQEKESQGGDSKVSQRSNENQQERNHESRQSANDKNLQNHINQHNDQNHNHHNEQNDNHHNNQQHKKHSGEFQNKNEQNSNHQNIEKHKSQEEIQHQISKQQVEGKENNYQEQQIHEQNNINPKDQNDHHQNKQQIQHENQVFS